MKRRAWRIALGIVGTMALLLGAFWLWVSTAADRRWEEMRADILRRKQAAAQRVCSREPLRGEPLPGNAWDDYMAADAAIQNTTGAQIYLHNLFNRSAGVDRVAAEGIVRSCQPALDLLRSGGRRLDLRLPEAPPFRYPGLHRVKLLVVCRARMDIDAGHTPEAMELLLDFVRAVQDSSFNTTVSGLSRATGSVEEAYEELRRAAMKGGLTTSQRETFERELEILDRTTPALAPLVENILIWVGDGIQENPVEFLRSDTRKKWLLMVQPRLHGSSVYCNFAERLPLLARIDGMSWAEERTAWMEFDRRDPTKESQWGRRPFTLDAHQNRARLRLLRMVFHKRRTGDWLDLGDPFGVKLLHSETATHLRAWSVGPDGVDNGGKGSWKPRDGEDLLLEIPK